MQSVFDARARSGYRGGELESYLEGPTLGDATYGARPGGYQAADWSLVVQTMTEERGKSVEKWGFIYTLGDAGAASETTRIGTPACRLVCVGVPTVDDGPAAARRLVDEGAQLIELCGAFAGPGLAAVLAAVDGKAPVGAVFYGGEAATGLHRLFG